MYMKELPQVEIIVCNAVHDELDRPENLSLPYCHKNAICSHGNKIIDAAIEKGVRTQILTAERAQIFQDTLEDTRIKLIQWADRMANTKRQLRLRLSGAEDQARTEEFAVALLGPDRSKWNEIHGQRQLEISEPIRDIVQELEQLGLLTCTPEPQFIDTEAVLADNQNHVYVESITKNR